MLKKESSIVVEGEIVDTDVFKYKVNDEVVPYTIYKIKVPKAFVGDVNVGDTVNIAEYGGGITAEEAGLDNKFPNMSEKEKKQKIGFSFGVPLSIETTKASVYSQVAMGDMLAIKSVNGIVYMQFFSNDVYTRGEYIGESSAFIGFPEQGSVYLSNESPDVIILWYTADSQVTLKKTDISPEQYKIEYEQMKEMMNNGTRF